MFQTENARLLSESAVFALWTYAPPVVGVFQVVTGTLLYYRARRCTRAVRKRPPRPAVGQGEGHWNSRCTFGVALKADGGRAGVSAVAALNQSPASATRSQGHWPRTRAAGEADPHIKQGGGAPPMSCAGLRCLCQVFSFKQGLGQATVICRPCCASERHHSDNHNVSAAVQRRGVEAFQ